MTLTNFIRLLLHTWKWLLALPLLAAIAVFIIIGLKDKRYESSLNIYTGFASGYNIANQDNSKVDYFAVNTALDNLINTIKSETVLQKVGLTLFAQSMIYGAKGDSRYIGHSSYEKLLAIVPDSVVAIIDPSSVDNSVRVLEEYLKQNNSNFVYELVHLYHSNYSVWALSNIDVKRQGNSDLLRVSYVSNDPALCQQTLIILGREFLKHYQSMREFQTHDVVKYFEDQLAASAARLGLAEDRFMNYSKENRVINYYEQTKAVAGQLQSFELDYDKILSFNAGAKKSVEQLESKIGMHARLRLKSEQVLAERARIAERTAVLTAQSIFMEDSSYVRFDSRKFDNAVTQGQQELRNTLDTMDIYKNSPEGIEVDNILDQWLDNVVKYDASTAAIAVLDKRREEINKKFDFFAPVGATVKRQEREIGINESEYLSLLHSLALAKLQQQNIQMSSSSMRVVDEPTFPIQAMSNKRKLLSVMAFFVTLFLVIAVLVIIEMTDRTLRDAKRAAGFSGLEVISLLPINHVYDKNCCTGRDELAFSQLMTQVIRLRQPGLPMVINLLSFENSEGKSYVGSELAAKFADMGYTVRRLVSGADFMINSKAYIEARSVVELSGSVDFDVYIVEYPAMNTGIVPPEQLATSSLNLLIARANRAWHASDVMLVKALKNSSVNPPYLVLNGVDEDALEVFIGEIPKQRSSFRQFVKRIVTREFYAKHKNINF